MSTDDDNELRDMLIQSLEKNGTLAKLRAQLRASVFLALEEQEKVKNKTPLLNEKAHKFIQTNDGRLCCELVADLMKNLNLDATESVFLPEINLKDVRPRNVLEKSLGVQVSAEDRDQPLLFSLLKSINRQGSSGDVKKPTENVIKSNINVPKPSMTKKNVDADDEQFRSVNDEDDFFGDAGDSKINYAFPGFSTVTERQKSIDRDSLLTKPTPPSSTLNDKKSSAAASSTLSDKKSNVAASSNDGSSSKLLSLSNSGGGGSLSFLGDLPDIPKKSGLPPLGGTGDLKKSSESNSTKQQNLLKILGGSFDDIENESPRLSTASNDDSPKSPQQPTKDKNDSKSNAKSVVADKKPKEDLFRKRSDDDDDISEEIVEDLEVDDLLSSARSAHQLSF